MEPMRINRMQIFDDEMAALRTHVERYIERGFCEIDRRIKQGVLNREGIVLGMCSAIAKQLGRPFITLLADPQGGVWMAMPARADLKHLRTPIIIAGKEGYEGPVSYRLTKSTFHAHFTAGTGTQMLESWKELVQTDRACRFALKLPTLPTLPRS